eukprot:1720320-Rhodomonas_salina.1
MSEGVGQDLCERSQHRQDSSSVTGTQLGPARVHGYRIQVQATPSSPPTLPTRLPATPVPRRQPVR